MDLFCQPRLHSLIMQVNKTQNKQTDRIINYHTRFRFLVFLILLRSIIHIRLGFFEFVPVTWDPIHNNIIWWNLDHCNLGQMLCIKQTGSSLVSPFSVGTILWGQSQQPSFPRHNIYSFSVLTFGKPVHFTDLEIMPEAMHIFRFTYMGKYIKYNINNIRGRSNCCSCQLSSNLGPAPCLQLVSTIKSQSGDNRRNINNDISSISRFLL